MMDKLRVTYKALLLALIPFIMLLFFNHVSNWHYHWQSNGILVKHAHPYNKAEHPESPVKGHTHTSFEFFVLSQLSALSLVITFILVVLMLKAWFRMHRLYTGTSIPFLQHQYLKLQLLRGPPTMQIS